MYILSCTVFTWNAVLMVPQQDPVSFIVIAESIYALWPNVLLLFGLLFVSVEADDRLRLRPIKKELKKVKSLVTVSISTALLLY
jgi:hypothetical protein